MKQKQLSKSNLIGNWDHPLTIERNNFKYKSLSNFSANIAVGCSHACRFCYVPEVSTNRMADRLKPLGVEDPDRQWGEYVYLRKWDQNAFRASIKRAMKAQDLPKDGHGAIMYCTTTDAYMMINDPKLRMNQICMVRESLRMILEESDLNVRILTRSPLAKLDFDLMKEFGPRLTFGMSIPTLDNKLARVYEPNAPAPTQRLETLKAAKAAGLNVFVAMAPTYPECHIDDLQRTLTAFKDLDPITIFHEPINIRAENVARIEKNAEKEGVKLFSWVFTNSETWRNYSFVQLRQVEGLANALGIQHKLHLWPDPGMMTQDAIKQFSSPSEPTAENYQKWIRSYWNRISEWPLT
jgi:DNA repair photolyase